MKHVDGWTGGNDLSLIQFRPDKFRIGCGPNLKASLISCFETHNVTLPLSSSFINLPMYRGFFSLHDRQSAGRTLQSVFIILSKGCDRLSSCRNRLLNRYDSRRTTKRWHSDGRSVGQTLIGQADRKTPYIKTKVEADPRIRGFIIRGFSYPRFTAARKKKLESKRNKRFVSFKTRAKPEQAVTWWNPAVQTRQVLDSSSLVLVPTSLRKLANILLLAFSLFQLVAMLSQCLC